jgi:cytochrome c5
MPEPAAAPAVADDFDVAGTYQMRCFACHGTGAAGAPVLGDADAWGERMAKGMETVMANAINGIGAMPARGLCMDCTDEHIEALITYMAEGGQ